MLSLNHASTGQFMEKDIIRLCRYRAEEELA
jgi:hypothetical protein